MRSIFDAYTVPIVIAFVIGLAIGWWVFRRMRSRAELGAAENRQVETGGAAPAVEQERPLTRTMDGPEGNGLIDEGAAAASDVAGEVLGLQVHSQLPGASGPPDDLSIMKGVGPKFVGKLNENGITRFDQLAALSENEVAMLDDKMGPFKGRLRRDRIVEQASYLARGDRDGFEAKFGKLGGA